MIKYLKNNDKRLNNKWNVVIHSFGSWELGFDSSPYGDEFDLSICEYYDDFGKSVTLSPI